MAPPSPFYHTPIPMIGLWEETVQNARVNCSFSVQWREDGRGRRSLWPSSVPPSGTYPPPPGGPKYRATH